MPTKKRPRMFGEKMKLPEHWFRRKMSKNEAQHL